MSDAGHLQLPASPRDKSRHAGSLSSPNAGLDAGSKGASPVLRPDRLRSASASPLHFHHGRNSSPIPGNLLSMTSHGDSSRGFGGARKALAGFWTRNRGVLLVALSQFFGALMNLTARLLELEGNGMHPFQVLFARQGLTTICCVVYMWWTKVPDFPLGKKEVRWLLVVRGVSGFFGIYCLWYSMMYLPLAEATVISFLAPSVAGYICHIVLHEPFTRVEQLASVIALGGVVLIAHPQSLFSSNAATEETPTGAATNGTSTALPGLDHVATVSERLFAIGSALIGVLGAAGAFTTIRWIGKRAHPLISVNYFAAWCTIVCTVVLIGAPMLDIGQPAIRFGLPASIRQWVMLFLLGIFGFVMQFMMTAGLGSDRSNRANAMIYTHMLFAAGFDRWVFGHYMGLMSLAGCGLIIGSMLWAVLSKSESKQVDGDVETGTARDAEEMQMMMVGQEDSDPDSDGDDDSFRHLP